MAHRPASASNTKDDRLHSLMTNLLQVPGAARVFQRVPLAVQIGLRGAGSVYLGASENISDGGLFVNTAEPRPIGDHFPVEFSLPNDETPVHCIVEVMWIREANNLRGGEAAGMGLKFVALDLNDQARVTKFVASTR